MFAAHVTLDIQSGATVFPLVLLVPHVCPLKGSVFSLAASFFSSSLGETRLLSILSDWQVIPCSWRAQTRHDMRRGGGAKIRSLISMIYDPGASKSVSVFRSNHSTLTFTSEQIQFLYSDNWITRCLHALQCPLTAQVWRVLWVKMTVFVKTNVVSFPCRKGLSDGKSRIFQIPKIFPKTCLSSHLQFYLYKCGLDMVLKQLSNWVFLKCTTWTVALSEGIK